MKSFLRSRKLWLLVIPLALIFLAWLGFPAFMEYFSYHPETDYQTILRTSPAYDSTETAVVTFSYASANDPDLTKLRQTYQLDQIAGSGTDLEKAKNLLKWVHELIPHDGNHPLPGQRDALALIDSVKSSGRGLNCRGLAIVLSEALLSVGLQARFVELLPRDFSTDSRVITLVYISELGKWVFLDPTYQAWFIDAAGQPLNLDEIRASLIQGRTLTLNPEANYNGGPVDVDYPNYLAKNLYRLASPQRSAFGIDSASERVMVMLNPAGDNAGRRNPFQAQIILHTPEIFWAKP